MEPNNYSLKSGIIKSDEFDSAQKVHANAIIYIPTLGVVGLMVAAYYWDIAVINFWLFLLFYYLTMVAGITVGYHRLLTHRSFQTGPLMRAGFAILGCMAAQGAPAYWVSNHRRHHQFSDQPGDPHSPKFSEEKAHKRKWQGFMHSHFRWMYTHHLTSTSKYAKDILQDKHVMWVGKYYLVWVYLGLIIPPLIVWLATQDIQQCIIAFLGVGLSRLFITFHATSSINSLCHMFGQRGFNTKEFSTNILVLAIPTGGESWHNNHHAFPHSARFGLRWWQVDLGYISIYLLEKMGLAWSVKLAGKTRNSLNS